MTTFDNIFNNVIWKKETPSFGGYWIKTDESRKDDIKKVVKATLQFLIKNRHKTYTFTTLIENVDGLAYRSIKVGTTGGIRVDFVLGAVNNILFALWNLKEGNKIYKIPPISAIVLTQQGNTNRGGIGFIEEYIEKFFKNEIEEDEEDEFVRDKIKSFDRWDDVLRILFKENYTIKEILKDKKLLTEIDRKALHSELQTHLEDYLKKYKIYEMKRNFGINDGREIDLYLPNENIIIEVKIANSDWYCLRHSIGQLMEYNYLLKKESYLICVGNNKLTSDLKDYIDNNEKISDIIYAWEEDEKFLYYKSNTTKKGELKDWIKNLRKE